MNLFQPTAYRTPVMTLYTKTGKLIYIHSYKCWRSWKYITSSFLLCSSLVGSIERFCSVRFWAFSVYSENSLCLGICVSLPVYPPLKDTELCTQDYMGALIPVFRLLNHYKSQQQCFSLQTLGGDPLIREWIQNGRQHNMLTTPNLKTHNPKLHTLQFFNIFLSAV